MRLLSIADQKLSFHFDELQHPYVILSHTWGSEETTLQDLANLSPAALATQEGWIKITKFCQIARQVAANADYVWVDTCCIDKTSSAELSEAINSMFRWYRQSLACVVYLSDVEDEADFEKSRWFTRGWTLQELLAPSDLHFYDKNWRFMGHKADFAHRMSEVTKIDVEVLMTGYWGSASVAQRMSWASRRQTTRKEDMAYCLLGIFDVNMPLLYGEGEKAFVRLQEEIMKESDDESVFAWDASAKSEGFDTIGALATHPRFFTDGARIESLPSRFDPPVLTSKGIRGNLRIVEYKLDEEAIQVMLLNCRYVYDMNLRVGVRIKRDLYRPSEISRTRHDLISIPLQRDIISEPPLVYFVKRDRLPPPAEVPSRCFLRFESLPDTMEPQWTVPAVGWHISATRTMTLMLPKPAPGASGKVVAQVGFQGKLRPITIWVVMVIDLEKRECHVALRALTMAVLDSLRKQKLFNKWLSDGQSAADATEASVQNSAIGLVKATTVVTSSYEITLTTGS